MLHHTRTLDTDRPTLAAVLIVVFALTLNASADYKSLSIDTNASRWSIYRENNNISFNLSSTVEGKISPVESHGRILSPYQSYYEEIGSNDVHIRQRTNALEGNYKSSDEIKFKSAVLDEVEVTVDKPAGTNIYTIEYKNENWPVFLRASRTLAYSGQQINNREFEGNNGDFVGANFLYNHKLSKEQKSVIWLQSMNATVLATDEAILLAEFKPTKYLGYLIRAHSTGIADLSYLQRDFRYDIKHQNYPATIEGEERYYGTYNLARKIEMQSVFEKFNYSDDEAASWLSYCGDWEYQKNFDTTRDVFDCTCYKEKK